MSKNSKNQYDLSRSIKRQYFNLRWLFGVCGGAILILIAFIGLDINNVWIVMAVTIMLLFGFITLKDSLNTAIWRIVISPKEIKYQGIGYQLHIPWDNIYRITSDGLFLSHPGVGEEKWYSFHSKQRPPRSDYLIPLDMFGKNWQTSSLGRKLKHYAPHLEEQYQDEMLQILVVVNIKSVEWLEKALHRLKHKVSKAVTGEEALKEIEQRAPDLILIDIDLPGTMDGIETVAQIWDKYNIPIIYLTWKKRKEVSYKVQAIAPFDYLLWPFTDNDLKVAIEISRYRDKAGII